MRSSCSITSRSEHPHPASERQRPEVHGIDERRVQQIADATGLNEGLNLTSLGHSIHHLINASRTLDIDTKTQLEHLHKLLPPPPPPPPHHKPEHDHGSLKQTLLKVCAAIGFESCEERLHQSHHDHGPKRPELPKKRVEAIKKVLLELRVGNKKRQAFEGGFISEEGIKVSLLSAHFRLVRVADSAIG